MVQAVLKAIRIHQWTKNFLVFVPLLMAHQFLQGPLLFQSIAAFFAFSLCASGVYLINDLIDLEHDRSHPIKKHRPFASGRLPLSAGRLGIPFLLVGSVLIVTRLPATFGLFLGGYFLLTFGYSVYFKRLPLIDVIVLAFLYTFRIFAGGAAADIPLSPWLLAFSMFLFLSLAYAKRFSELHLLHVNNSEFGKGRGYMGKDLGLIANLGVTSGYLAVLVMALYINSREVVSLYSHPQVLWLVCPLLLYWISHIWLYTRRGQKSEDPIFFAITDPASYVAGLLTLLTLAVAI